MDVVRSIAACRAVRRAAPGSWGCVPTMGYLHAGHLALVERARAENERVAVSIFVNPLQFGPQEDLARYPRDLERDLGLLVALGVALVFAPAPEELYPSGFATTIDAGPVAAPLEGAARPGHFRGVATVVAKLFNIVQPDRAYFGQKDAQQVAVIRRMTRDLDLPVRIVVCPTVREPDGLALSSRNVYLQGPERAAAPVLYRALGAARDDYAAGTRDAEALRARLRAVFAAEPLARPEYVSVADPETLAELDTVGPGGALLSLAVRIGATRLIDNLLVGIENAPGEAAPSEAAAR
jgi:pantoate--beta-alanine ligase